MLRQSADGNASFFGEDEAGRAVMLSANDQELRAGLRDAVEAPPVRRGGGAIYLRLTKLYA